MTKLNFKLPKGSTGAPIRGFGGCGHSCRGCYTRSLLGNQPKELKKLRTNGHSRAKTTGTLIGTKTNSASAEAALSAQMSERQKTFPGSENQVTIKWKNRIGSFKNYSKQQKISNNKGTKTKTSGKEHSRRDGTTFLFRINDDVCRLQSGHIPQSKVGNQLNCLFPARSGGLSANSKH
jgi:hypothetical protein